MVVRERKKKNKLRGQRTHGGGGTKNRRGAGSRGGVGKAGSHKHKFSKYYVDFGVKKTLKAKPRGESISLGVIEENITNWVAKENAQKENDFIVIDGKKLGFYKVLSTGTIKEKIKLINAQASKKAIEKIESVGGKVELNLTEIDEDFEPEDKEEAKEWIIKMLYY